MLENNVWRVLRKLQERGQICNCLECDIFKRNVNRHSVIINDDNKGKEYKVSMEAMEVGRLFKRKKTNQDKRSVKDVEKEVSKKKILKKKRFTRKNQQKMAESF